ncbi:MAG: ankyrin repeat domain-containing protein [Clostridia bacterium]
MIKYLQDEIPALEITLSDTDELFYRAAFGELENKELDIALKNSRGETLINIAAKYGNVENVKLLYEKGADIRVKGYNGLYDALDYAIENGHTEVVKYFAERGEQVIRRDDHIYMTTERNLRKCVSEGNYACLAYVLEAFKEVYNKDDFTGGAVVAIGTNDMKCLKLLLDYGADIDKLTEACLIEGNVEIARFLTDKGADFSKVDEGLYYAIKFHSMSDGTKLADFLIKTFPSLIETDVSAIPAAIERGNIKAVKLLSEGGIDLNKRYFDKNITALMCAATSTDEIFEYLVDIGADICAQDTDGKTVQDYLSHNGCVDQNKKGILSLEVCLEEKSASEINDAENSYVPSDAKNVANNIPVDSVEGITSSEAVRLCQSIFGNIDDETFMFKTAEVHTGRTIGYNLVGAVKYNEKQYFIVHMLWSDTDEMVWSTIGFLGVLANGSEIYEVFCHSDNTYSFGELLWEQSGDASLPVQKLN